MIYLQRKEAKYKLDFK